MQNKTYTLEPTNWYWVHYDQKYLYSISVNFPQEIVLEDFENLFQIKGSKVIKLLQNRIAKK